MMQGISSLGGIYSTYVISDRHFVVLTTKHCSNFGGKGGAILKAYRDKKRKHEGSVTGDNGDFRQ